MLYGICTFLFSIVETTIVVALLSYGNSGCSWEVAICVTRTIGFVLQGYLYRYTNPSFACLNETRNLTLNNILLPLTMFSLLALVVQVLTYINKFSITFLSNMNHCRSFIFTLIILVMLIRTLFYCHLFLHFGIINIRLYISAATRDRDDINNANGARRNDDYQILPDGNNVNDAGGERTQ